MIIRIAHLLVRFSQSGLFKALPDVLSTFRQEPRFRLTVKYDHNARTRGLYDDHPGAEHEVQRIGGGASRPGCAIRNPRI